MKVNQVYAIVNSLTSQLFGKSAIAVTDTRGLRALGEQVSTAAGYDKFLGILVDRIGKTVVRTLDSQVDIPGLLRSDMEYGAMLQKITVNLPEAITNAAWDIADPNFTPTNFDIHLPSATVTYFAGIATWKIQQTVPEDPMLNSAFNSAEAMGAFITGIMDSMAKAIIEQINAVSYAAIASFAVEKADRTSSTVINLLTIYNSTFTETLTAATALENKDFLRWANREINRYISYLDTPSVLYNEGDNAGNDVLRRTTRDNMHVWLHTDFVQGVKTWLQSDTFNRDLVELPYYNEIKMWQGSSNTLPTTANVTSIHALAQNGDNVKMDYVIGMLVDRQAIAIGKYQQQSATQPNPIDGYVNYAIKCNIGHMVDLSENGIIFTLAAPTVTPASA